MDSETIEATAAHWLTRRHGEAWTEESQRQLDSWLNESTYHRVAYIRLEATWQHTARLKALGAGVPVGVIPPPGTWRIGLLTQAAAAIDAGERPRTATPPLGWIAIAAALVLALLAGIYLIVLQPRPERYATDVGRLRTIHLADKSVITLNTKTQIRVYLQNRERRIDLDSGEAFFVVARDPARPFVIHVADKRIIAVGTQFSVRRLAAEVQVLVTEGRVGLAWSLARPLDRTTTLDAGTVARTSHSEVLVQPASEGQTEQLLGWRTGFVIFNGTPLAAALEEFNRYREDPVVLADPSIAGIRIGGKFRTTNIEGFLALLQEGFPVSVERSSDTVVLKRRP